MLGLNLSEMIFLAIIFVPLVLFMIGIVWVASYIVYLLVRDRFSDMMHFRHRRAH